MAGTRFFFLTLPNDLFLCFFFPFFVNVFDYNSSFLNTQAEGGGCPKEDEMAVLSVSVFLNETFTLNLVEYHMCRVRVTFVLVMSEVPL